MSLKNNIQVLFSAMYQKDTSLPIRSNVKGDFVVINQTNFEEYPNFTDIQEKCVFISNTERGLSRSRNLALKYATGNICLLADDDIKYVDNFETIVENAYIKYKDADLILFDFYEKDSQRKRKPVMRKAGRLNIVTVLRGNSIRISFKLSSINRENVRFNKFFGAGSNYFTSGEDIIFLIDCLKKKLKIYYVPSPILYLEDSSQSSWFHGFNEQYFKNIGAFSYYYMKNFWSIYVIQFLLRHKQFKKDGLSFLEAYRITKQGVKNYKKLINK